jgi:hypothetical protein
LTTAADGAGGQPAVRGLSDGGFVAAWTDDSRMSGDSSPSGVSARIVTSDLKFGNKFLVNSATLRNQFNPAITALLDHFIVTWTDQSETGGDASGTGVKAQVFRQGSQPVG